MRQRNEFDYRRPDFTHNGFKWYLDDKFNDYISSEQASNLPSLKGLGCFVVISADSQEYVLIDDKQNVISAYPYSPEGQGQMEAKINIIKISQHFNQYEEAGI